ncbi:olfactory receptor 6E1-like [Pungitius pungitius]|uniref:olfactory receptor 6E1-like n=1 Tax=Pungitius pungitius TaxID=134920 RepID=UPI002E0D212C
MINSTKVSYFILSAYVDTGLLKYLWFMVIMSLYVLIVCSNLLLIVVICMNRSLHEPMYLFLCSLFVNELFGSTGLFPFLLVQILSDIHTVSYSSCYLQIFCLFFYACLEFFNLAIMSYDRYLAICYPLHYNTCMTCIHLFFSLLSGPISSLQLCGNIINKVYCDNYPINKLACSDTTASNIYGLFATFLCNPNLYSYDPCHINYSLHYS